MTSNGHPVWQGHGQEAKRRWPGGHRITRNCEAIASFLLTCATAELSLIAAWWLTGATSRGQPWTPVVTLSHRRDGLSARRMAVLCTFREPSLRRHVHREFMHNAVLDLTPIIPTTACHQRNDVERYSRYKRGTARFVAVIFPIFVVLSCGEHHHADSHTALSR